VDLIMKIWSRFRTLLKREEFDRELDEEMQFHQELQAEAYQESGMNADEAKLAARRRFGNPLWLREAGWHAWGGAPVERVLQDLRFAIRTIRRNPRFAISVVLLLGMAIWMNATVYSVIHAVMLAPLPFDHPEELVNLCETYAGWPISSNSVTPANFVDLRIASRSFDSMAAIGSPSMILDQDATSNPIPAAFVTADFFKVLRIPPLLGRSFLPDDYSSLHSYSSSVQFLRVAIISYGLWQRQFGGDPAVIGRTVRLRNPVTDSEARIVGVMPASLASAESSIGKADIWMPMALAADESPTSHSLKVIARRRSEVSNRQAQAEMKIITGRLKAKRPGPNAVFDVRVIDPHNLAPGNYRASLLFLAGAVILVLMLACANVANLMLARGAARRREMATRSAIGAGRARLVVQLAAECLLLCLSAGMLGFLLSLASIRAVVALVPPDLPQIDKIGVNPAVFGFCLCLVMVTCVFCGVLPALRVSAFDLTSALKEGGMASRSGARGRLSRTLVVMEIAASLLLLIGAGLLARSFVNVQTLKLGFAPDHVLAVDLQPTGTFLGKSHGCHEYPDLFARLREIPDVEAVADGPIFPHRIMDYYAEGSAEPVHSNFDVVSSRYFQTLNIPLLAGRLFSDSDFRVSSDAILNYTAARQAWPDGDAIGKRINTSIPNNPRWSTVIGIVGDMPGLSGISSGPLVYMSSSGPPNCTSRLLIRTSGKASALAPIIRSVIRSVDSTLMIYRMATVEESIAAETAGLRFNALLMTIFAALAFVLAASGVYSLMSYTVMSRTREMSIRMAMGANRSDILSLVVRNGAVLVGIGVVLGLAGALGAARLASTLPPTLLYQVQSKDPISFCAPTILLVAAALAACYIPARRAAGLDVVETLRHE
jgi:putative ABC transport system permease protein